MRALPVFIFNLLFYLILALGLILLLPLLLFPPKTVYAGLAALFRLLIGLQSLFGQKVEFRGLSNIPKGGCLVASKHQSMWETLMLGLLFDDPGFIYKRELNAVPLFGWYLQKFDMVPIDRAKWAAALQAMTEQAADKIRQGRQIIVFPEGTRREAEAAPAYKKGIAYLYEKVKAPVVPMALNSGVYWSKYFWRGKQGTIVIEALPPIAPGLSRDEFMGMLQERLEGATNKLLQKT